MPSFCRIAGRSGISSSQLQQIDYQRNVIPPAMRSPTPMEMFLYRSQTAGAHKIPGKHTCVNYTFYSCTCNICTYLVEIIVINFITCWLFKQARTLYSDWLTGLATFFVLTTMNQHFDIGWNRTILSQYYWYQPLRYPPVDHCRLSSPPGFWCPTLRNFCDCKRLVFPVG